MRLAILLTVFHNIDLFALPTGRRHASKGSFGDDLQALGVGKLPRKDYAAPSCEPAIALKNSNHRP